MVSGRSTSTSPLSTSSARRSGRYSRTTVAPGDISTVQVARRLRMVSTAIGITTPLERGEQVRRDDQRRMIPRNIFYDLEHDVLLEEVVAIGERNGGVDFACDVDLQLALEGSIRRGKRRTEAVEAIELGRPRTHITECGDDRVLSLRLPRT